MYDDTLVTLLLPIKTNLSSDAFFSFPSPYRRVLFYDFEGFFLCFWYPFTCRAEPPLYVLFAPARRNAALFLHTLLYVRCRQTTDLTFFFLFVVEVIFCPLLLRALRFPSPIFLPTAKGKVQFEFYRTYLRVDVWRGQLQKKVLCLSDSLQSVAFELAATTEIPLGRVQTECVSTTI